MVGLSCPVDGSASTLTLTSDGDGWSEGGSDLMATGGGGGGGGGRSLFGPGRLLDGLEASGPGPGPRGGGLVSLSGNSFLTRTVDVEDDDDAGGETVLEKTTRLVDVVVDEEPLTEDEVTVEDANITDDGRLLMVVCWMELLLVVGFVDADVEVLLEDLPAKTTRC